MSLCTLAEVKLHIGLDQATHDTLLTALVDEASGVINAATLRQIEIADITEFHDGEMQNSIILHEYPVAEDPPKTIVLTEDGEAIDAADFIVDFDQGVLRLLDGAQFTQGESNIKVVYRAGFSVAAVTPAGETALPFELRLACKVIAGRWFQLRENLGVSQKRFQDGTTSYKEKLDEDIMALLDRHKRVNVG